MDGKSVVTRQEEECLTTVIIMKCEKILDVDVLMFQCLTIVIIIKYEKILDVDVLVFQCLTTVIIMKSVKKY